MRRAGLLALEAVGLAVAAAAACAGFLMWRVQSKPVDLDWAAPIIRMVANAAAFNGAVADIESIELAKAQERGGYRLILDDVMLRRGAAGASARLPHVDIVFHPSDFLSGRAGPRRLFVDGAALRIVRRADRRVKLDFGEGADDRARVFQSLTGGAYFREAFETAELKNVSISFIDETSGRKWTGRGGSAIVKRTSAGYAASLASTFDLGGKSSALNFQSSYDLKTEVISSTLAVDAAPVGDLIAVFFNERAELLTSPVSGSAMVDLDKTGAVLASRIDLRASGGKLDLGGFSTPVEALEVAAAFDPSRNEFTVEHARWRAGVGVGDVGGVVSLTQPESGKGVEQVNFALEVREAAVDLPALLPAPLAIDGAALTGAYAIGAKRLDLEKVDAALLGLGIRGTLSVARAANASPMVKSNLTIDGALSPQQLLMLWPTKLALGARDFISERMPSGAFSNIDVMVDLKEGGIGADGALPDEALAISFRADGATVHYAPGMTPLTGVAGRGLLKGNSFKFDAEKASVAKVRVLQGEVAIPVLMPKGELASFRFRASGDAGDMLAILDQEPLRVLKETKFSPAQFKGPVEASVEIQRPNLRVALQEDYRYKGVATFPSLSVDNIVADASLEAVKGRLDLATDSMFVAGAGRVGEAPVAIEWRQRFFGAGDKTFITVTGEADSALADHFGIPTRQMAQGGAPFKAVAVGGVDAFRALDLEADFTNAILMSEPLGWVKPKGVPAKGTAKFAFSKEAAEIEALEIRGDTISIDATATFGAGGALQKFVAPTFRMEGAADLKIAGERDQSGQLKFDVSGDYLNAAEMVRKLIDEGFDGGGAKTPLWVAARVNRVDFRGGARLQDASLDYRRGVDGRASFSFDAKAEGGNPLSIGTEAPPAGEQLITARSENVGALLAGLFAMSSVKGGHGDLAFRFTPGEKEAPRTGSLEAHDIRIVRAPLLAKIFAAGSLTGLADLVNGDGIELENARADFAIEDGEIRIAEARATGPSVGITGEGAFALEGARDVSLRGAVAPAYQINSFLGKAPVIGELFVNRKGEGLLALSYEVEGPASEPRVTVNPLSALAPGVFRRMFEGGQGEAPPKEPPAE